MTTTRQPIDLRMVAPEDRSRVVMQDMHRRAALMAAHVAEESADVPDSVSARVFALEEELALELGKITPDWDKQRQIAEDALIDMLDDAPRGRGADWAWFE